jgi:hypothetical protein
MDKKLDQDGMASLGSSSKSELWGLFGAYTV